MDLRERLPVHPALVYDSRSVGSITQIVVHHAGAEPLNRGVEAFAQATAVYHINPHGPKQEEWPGIGYHIVLGTDGEWAYCNSLKTISYHVGRNNPISFGVCMEGDYRMKAVPHFMVDALEEIVRWAIHSCKAFAEDNGWPFRGVGIIGHRQDQYAATACPGDRGMEAVEEVKRRIG